jgi:FMN phosphatase YigB (HAD superfamily)
MVGDSWANDVAGATNAGIRAVWFNPDRKPAPGPPWGVAEIHALAPAHDVLRLLLGSPSPVDAGSGETGGERRSS